MGGQRRLPVRILAERKESERCCRPLQMTPPSSQKSWSTGRDAFRYDDERDLVTCSNVPKKQHFPATLSMARRRGVSASPSCVLCLELVGLCARIQEIQTQQTARKPAQQTKRRTQGLTTKLKADMRNPAAQQTRKHSCGCV